jgi:elongation factor P--(R)-beta-lysine ligase
MSPDTDWRPLASMDALQLRAAMLARIRDFFARRGVLEVTTPLITPSGITDLHIESLALADGRFLRTSPEYQHKRLLAAGFPDLYELGPVFRAEEHGRCHRTEFTLLEWYRLGFDWRELAEEVAELIRLCLTGQDLRLRYLAWSESFSPLGDFDPLNCEPQHLLDLTPTLPDDCNHDMRLDYLFATAVQPDFPIDTITVIHDYPASQAALARLKPDDQRVAERFEVFVGPVELANGYRELTQAGEQGRRLAADNASRLALGRRAMPIDQRFLAALDHGLPDCSGVALGVDRLLMIAIGSQDIADTIAFD